MAAAVSNAGGLGILTALTQPNPEALRAAIRKTRSLTDKNFGVNVTLLPSINPPDYEGYAKVAVDEGITVFETAGNNRGRLSWFVCSCLGLIGCSWSSYQVLQVQWLHRSSQM
jgi:NAD(P)H-dependent flavin oxidoreductase YrpB (nitropropane dioxygenase family)